MYREIEFAQYGATNLHPLVIVFMICMTGLTLASRRSAVVFAVLAICVLMPMEQRVVIGGLDFSMLRLIMIVAWTRVLVKGEYRGFRMGELDWLFLAWAFSASLFYVLRVGPGGIVYRLGVSFDSLTAYFLIRMLVRTRGEVLLLWRHLAWVVVAVSPFFLYEATAHHNVFGMFDYAGFEPVEIRDGRARSQGPFSHAILAGTFGAVVMPVFVGIFRGRRNQRILFGSACVGATIITVASGSSGPVIAWAVGAFGWSIWRFRKYMRPMLWGLVGLAVVIHFVREKPLWHLIARLSSLTGGTGYHRYYLIDAFIRNFSEWALVGTSNTAHWGYGLQDTTNRYVAEGVSGGLVTLVLFIVVLRTSFVQLRRARLVFERLEGPKSLSAPFAWGCSVSLAAHCVSFISVAYFGQMAQFFVLFVATVPAIARFGRRKRVKSRSVPLAAKTPTPIPATHFHSVS
jgi:hypothetical protein